MNESGIGIKRQRYVLTIEDGKQDIYPITDDTLFTTEDKIPRFVNMFMPGYSIRKRSSLEMVLRRWYFKVSKKLYFDGKEKRRQKRFSANMKRFHQKHNPHLFNE